VVVSIIAGLQHHPRWARIVVAEYRKPHTRALTTAIVFGDQQGIRICKSPWHHPVSYLCHNLAMIRLQGASSSHE